MECEYAKVLKSSYADQGMCTLTNGFCKYVYYCHTDRTVKNNPDYVDCKRRKKEKAK